jgi:hypothetical protein
MADGAVTEMIRQKMEVAQWTWRMLCFLIPAER